MASESTWPEFSADKPTYKLIQDVNYGKPKTKQYKLLQKITGPHIESFNYLIKEGLSKAVHDIPPYEYELPNGDRLCFEFKDAIIARPTVHKETIQVRDYRVYPAECRSRGITYKGKLQLTFSWSWNDQHQATVEKVAGEIPVMVKSDACNLTGLKPEELIKKGEEEEEMGGYFVINGNEKVIRMLIMQRRNYPIAMVRPSWTNRGNLFSEYGVSIRCVKPDQTSTNMVLHYLTDGTAHLMFSYLKELYFVPVVVILKALCDVTDHYIYTEIVKGKEDDTFFKGCIADMLREVQNDGLYNHPQIRKYMGTMFRVKLNLPSWYTPYQVTDFLLKNSVCPHLDNNVDKFNLLVFMIKKLFAVAKGECAIESPDNPMNHEVLLSGHLYLMVLKEKIEQFLLSIRINLERKFRSTTKPLTRLTLATINHSIANSMDLSRPMEYLLATGNLQSKSGLGLMQNSGLSIVADKLNFWRYLSHFRCVHRGAFFQGMRTTTARKLLPEAWGFLCPVHTPDGTPCGLMNHLAADCEIVTVQHPVGHLPRLLTSLGMTPLDCPEVCDPKFCYSVLLDGKPIGWVSFSTGPDLVKKLRYLKAKGLLKIPSTLEIGFVPHTGAPSQYPGLFLFSSPARMIRPVFNLQAGAVELIGTFEQVYLDICVVSRELHPGVTTHQELKETCMLSILGNQIPYSDFNQSPRNMYECQMGKQTMGTPCHTYRHRSDNKMYRIQNPQSPLVKPAMHDYYHMDDFPFGTNAIVAVISYTGYDMEDAMVINKASVERGFKHGSIYKSEFINLRDLAGDKSQSVSYIFGRKPEDKKLDGKIDKDGLPFIGNKVEYGDPICSYMDVGTGETRVEKYHSTEVGYILEVKLLGNDTGKDILQRICITFWIPRNPTIGDKFASRHGQKGICSHKWPTENMPFTESGMVPDIIFNPHGFPSRMTIGMMIESMAGKSASLHGLVHDATPFKFSEQQPASEYFGDLLQMAGYNYFGTERMYSGMDGHELEADIFFGVVYYQRLRHMVADKFQVRTTGPVDILTQQPMKGRKRGGGIRFGEMERDALLAHGTSFLLHDRLFNCSDKSTAHICKECGSLFSPYLEKEFNEDMPASRELTRSWVCSICKSSKNVVLIAIPFVFRYLAAELAAMNISIKFEIK